MTGSGCWGTVSVLQVSTVLWMAGGGGCTKQEYSLPVSCILIAAKMVHFIVIYILPQFKKVILKSKKK